MKLRHLYCAMLPGLLVVSACNLLTPLAFVLPQKSTVSAEFDKLQGRRVAVLVWTDSSTLFDYPYARFELATFISNRLSRETTDRGRSVDVVDPRDVEDFIQKNIGAQSDPRSVGRALKADYVIYVETLRFQFRDAVQPQFLRGQIDGAVSVHDMNAELDELQRYDLAQVRCRHPEGPPVVLTATNAPEIREATYRKFALLVAQKFYAYTTES